MLGRVRLAREPHAPVIFSGDGTPENYKTYTKMKPMTSRSQWYLKWLERRFGRLSTEGLKSRPGGPPKFPARLRISFVLAPLLSKFSRYALLLLGNKIHLSFALNLIKKALDLKLKRFKILAE